MNKGSTILKRLVYRLHCWVSCSTENVGDLIYDANGEILSRPNRAQACICIAMKVQQVEQILANSSSSLDEAKATTQRGIISPLTTYHTCDGVILLKEC